MLKAERLERVDQHNIEISRDAAMLKGIVENQHLRYRSLLQSLRSRRLHAVGILHVGHIGQAESSSRASSFAPLFRAVAATDERHCALVRRETKWRQPSTMRRLTGAADREIADANDGHIDPCQLRWRRYRTANSSKQDDRAVRPFAQSAE